MKYLLIENRGEIDPLALYLMGASDKRGDTGKIGMYGSGNKYALALLLRNSIPFRIFAGLDEIEVFTEKVVFKDQSFDKIKLKKGETTYDTSLTTQMGPQWQTWFIVREIYCNALDEGEHRIVPQTSIVSPVEGKTRYYIGVTPDIEDILKSWNDYFSNDRLDLYEEMPGLRIFLKKEKTLRVYRKGMLVYEDANITSIFDYDLDEAEITEERVLESIYKTKRDIDNILSVSASPDTIQKLLVGIHHAESKGIELFERKMTFTGMSYNIENWQNAIAGYRFVNSHVSGNYSEETSMDNTLILPADILSHFQTFLNYNSKIFGMASPGLNHSFRDYTPSEQINEMFQKAMHFMNQANLPYRKLSFKIVDFDDAYKISTSNKSDLSIFLSHKVFNEGVKQVVLTIMKEMIYMESGFYSCTERMEEYILKQWINTLESHTGTYL